MTKRANCLVLAGVVWAVSISVAVAAGARPVNVTAQNAWVRATLAGQDSAAVYMLLSAREPASLVGIDSPRARTATLHEMILDGGIMKMRQQTRLELPVGKVVMLKPGGYHIMLTGLKQPLIQGQVVPLRLHFEEGSGGNGNSGHTGVLEVNVEVRGLTARVPGA
ncbi:MAG: hypothetical protein RL695_1929, partial [Pseudomonadota bacterium]